MQPLLLGPVSVLGCPGAGCRCRRPPGLCLVGSSEGWAQERGAAGAVLGPVPAPGAGPSWVCWNSKGKEHHFLIQVYNEF